MSASIRIPFELFEVYHLTGEPKLTVRASRVTHATEISARIDDLWRQAQERRPNTYFDGGIVSLIEIGGSELFCQLRPYRDFLAQQHDAGLQAALNLRPLAVAGLLECADGIVFGRRSNTVTESAGKWELAPSGGVDKRFLEETADDILKLQLLTELEEEIGLGSADIDHITFLMVLRNFRSSVVDVGFYLYSRLSAAEIISRYRQLADKEYDELKVVGLSDLRNFLQEAGGQIDDVSLMLLQQRLKLTSQTGPSTGSGQHHPSGTQTKETPRYKRTVVIVQARSGSTRLPKKVLMPLGSRTVLEQCLLRCKAIEGIDAVVCATTTDPEDDRIAAIAEAVGALVFRGSVTDVLSRYYGAAQLAEAEVILRVTSDCPLIDSKICADVLRLRAEHDADYASNNMPPSFPHGLDCEAFTWDALKLANQEATDNYDREHVTPWIRRASFLRRKNLVGPGWPATTQRWTIDYPEDYALFAEMFRLEPDEQLRDMQSVLSLLARRQALNQINASHARHAILPDRPAIVFRFDADEHIGTGHAMRCATLTSRFEELGWPCFWAVTQETADFLGTRLPARQAIILPAATGIDQMAAISERVSTIHAIFFDHYALQEDFTVAARDAVRKIVWIDDFADHQLDADIVINATPGITADSYDGLLTGPAKMLLGGEAAPVRRQFTAARQMVLGRRAIEEPTLKRILIAFGGIDSLDGTSLALDAISDILPDSQVDIALGRNAAHLNRISEHVSTLQQHGRKVRLICDVADMTELMSLADLCIGAAGTAIWERSCLGLPSIIIGIAENQRPNAAALAEKGAAILCGFLTSDSRDQVSQNLKAELTRLKLRPEYLLEMGQLSSTLCDGLGTDRIVVSCLPSAPLESGKELFVRKAEATDDEAVLAWCRATNLRIVPGSNEASVADIRLIGEIDDKAVGFVQLSWHGDNRGSPIYRVLTAAAPTHARGEIAKGLLQMARILAPGATFLMPALTMDTASIALINSLDYRLHSDGFYWSLPES